MKSLKLVIIICIFAGAIGSGAQGANPKCEQLFRPVTSKSFFDWNQSLLLTNGSKISANTRKILARRQKFLQSQNAKFLELAENIKDRNIRFAFIEVADSAIRFQIAELINGKVLTKQQLKTLQRAHLFGKPPYTSADLANKHAELMKDFTRVVSNDFIRLGIAGQREDIALEQGAIQVTSNTTSYRENYISGVRPEEAFERAISLPLDSFLVGPAKALGPLFSREIDRDSKTVYVKGPGDGAVVTIALQFREDPRNPGDTILDDRVDRSIAGIVNLGHYPLTRPAEAITTSLRDNPPERPEAKQEQYTYMTPFGPYTSRIPPPLYVKLLPNPEPKNVDLSKTTKVYESPVDTRPEPVVQIETPKYIVGSKWVTESEFREISRQASRSEEEQQSELDAYNSEMKVTIPNLRSCT
ncbi:MAG: hypothetical protein ABL958_11435 [Bdellovibrionia bacterium]